MASTPAGMAMLEYIRDHARWERAYAHGLEVNAAHSLFDDLVKVGITDKKAGFLILNFVRVFLDWIISGPSNESLPGDSLLARSWTVSALLLPDAYRANVGEHPFKDLIELQILAVHDLKRQHSIEMTHLPHIERPHKIALTYPGDTGKNEIYRAMWMQVTHAHVPTMESGRFAADNERILAARPRAHGPDSHETVFQLRWFHPRKVEGVRAEKADLFAEFPVEEDVGFDKASMDYIPVVFHR
ncbi:hypothetical protein JCM10450v2_002972 [Rhodotorula kratochvilovae]